MLTRSANASPSIPSFHYAHSLSPRHSPSRNPAAAAPGAPSARRPSSSTSPLVSAAAVLTLVAASPSAAPSCPLSSPVASHVRPPTGPRASRSPPRYAAVDATTHCPPVEPSDHAAHAPRQHSPPSHQPPAGIPSALHTPSLQSTPREQRPTRTPAPMEPGVEQGAAAANGHYRQADGAQQLLGSWAQGDSAQGSLAPGAPATAPSAPPVSGSPSEPSTSHNTPPSTKQPPTGTQQQQQKQLYAASPQKRRSTQAQGPAAQEDGKGEGGTAAALDRPPSPPAAEDHAGNTKRAKPEAAPPKLLPAQYEFCAVEDMVVLIANMLGELIETNDALALKSGRLTRFHSRTPPGISVLDYLNRLAKHATLTPPLLLAMVYYIDRLCAMYPDFTINTLTVHRFLITAATVAAKGLSDSFWNNPTYARVGGVRVAELKMLELEFLYRLEWKIVPNPEVLAAYYRPLVERCSGYALPPDSSPARDEDDMTDGGSDGGRGASPDDRAGSSGAPPPKAEHRRQGSTSLIGEDLVASGLTLHGGQ